MVGNILHSMICKVFHQTCYFHPCFPDKQTEVLRGEVERLVWNPFFLGWVICLLSGSLLLMQEQGVPSKPGLSWAERALEFGG